MWDTSSHLEVDVRERARGASTRKGRGVQNHVRGRGEVGATSEAALEIVPRWLIKDPSLVWNSIFRSGAVEGKGRDGMGRVDHSTGKVLTGNHASKVPKERREIYHINLPKSQVPSPNSNEPRILFLFTHDLLFGPRLLQLARFNFLFSTVPQHRKSRGERDLSLQPKKASVFHVLEVCFCVAF